MRKPMSPSRIAAELRRAADRIDRSAAPSRSRVAASVSGILSHVAGQDWSHLEPLTPQDAVSSQLLWHAMKELGMEDWESDTNLDDVIEKMKELAASVGADQDAVMIGAVQYAMDNFDTFHELYNPDAPAPGQAMDR